MLLAVIILGITSCLFLFLFLFQKQETKSITRQLREIGNSETNALIHAENGFTARELVNEINALLKAARDNRIYYQQKRHNLEQMMTNISHDLRTPLTSALGYIDLIRRSGLPPEEKSREIDIVGQRLHQLEELIDSFFEFSKVIAGDKQPDMEELNLAAVLEASIARYYDDYCAQNRQIAFYCEKTKLYIFSNRNMLTRIFDNLIGNALKHGLGNLTVSVHEDDAVQISFENRPADSGLDISRIFDEFYTTDISRTKGNTGLGLAIAKQFSEMLGGSISASYQEESFCVTVSLPPKK